MRDVFVKPWGMGVGPRSTPSVGPQHPPPPPSKLKEGEGEGLNSRPESATQRFIKREKRAFSNWFLGTMPFKGRGRHEV